MFSYMRINLRSTFRAVLTFFIHGLQWLYTHVALCAGSLIDAFIAGMLGLAGGLVELWANCMSPVAASVVEFLSAVLSAFVARALITYVPPNSLCFYPTVLSALVWFLPGMPDAYVALFYSIVSACWPLCTACCPRVHCLLLLFKSVLGKQ